jgi:hypothetical protein
MSKIMSRHIKKWEVYVRMQIIALDAQVQFVFLRFIVFRWKFWMHVLQFRKH